MPKGSRGGEKVKGATAAKSSLQKDMNKLERAGFKYTGNGTWELDVPGIGGAQILDETGSTEALRMGLMPDQKLYSMIYWDDTGNTAADRQYFDTLNNAKYSAKNGLAIWLEDDYNRGKR